jgi:chitinase
MIPHLFLILAVSALFANAASINKIQPRGVQSMIVEITCRWSNCGELCPIGFVSVPRKGGAKDEMMWDHTQCRKSGGVSRLCCPSNQPQPTCLWRGFSGNGKCKPGCKGGEVEIWNIGYGCKSSYQSACCTTNTPSIEASDNCRWEGDAPRCWRTGYRPEPQCGCKYPRVAIETVTGFGGEAQCKQGTLHGSFTSTRYSESRQTDAQSRERFV